MSQDINSLNLKPGDSHYMAYVGPPSQYDIMGSSQFRLLCTLGLRAQHSLLDFGCGSLRAGRLFISYLDSGLYYGIEPNKWLINEAIKNQLGKDIIDLKKPKFSYNCDFKTDVFSRKFDFILAHSIFSHAGPELINIALVNFKASLNQRGIIAATFNEGITDFDGSGWVYRGCKDYNFNPSTKKGPVNYRISTIKEFSKKSGLSVIRIPWYHPRQKWYLFANNSNNLPNRNMIQYLNGAILFNHEFNKSWKRKPKVFLFFNERIKNALIKKNK